MNHTAGISWAEANQRHLTHAIAEVRKEIESSLDRKASMDNQNHGKGIAMAQAKDAPESAQPQPPSALESLCSIFQLSSFERKILLMCAGVELDSSLTDLLARIHRDNRRRQPTFGLGLGAFSDAHWSALSPARPLRYWQMIEVAPGESLTGASLCIQERVLHYLAGVQYLDERLRHHFRPVTPPEQLVPTHSVMADDIASIWYEAGQQGRLPVIELCGDGKTSKKAIASAAAERFGLQLHSLSAWNLPHLGAAELANLLRLWEREAILNSSALLLECDDAETPESIPAGVISSLVEWVRSPHIISTRTSRQASFRSIVPFDVVNPTPLEQAELWRGALQPSFPNVNGEVDALVSQFSLHASAICSAAGQVIGKAHKVAGYSEGNAVPDLGGRLWDACRVQARPRLEGLAQRISPAAGWDDLVLPERQKDVLRQVAVHVRQRPKVYHSWGFAAKGSRGLGISALFAGPSGTGKTMAAEVLAGELRLDLYRIDLSQVINKYIGETEKNLRRVFDAAEEGAAVLLFDEADALFGKRSEVKDSHDRYANIEVSYLLQRMEAYRGLAILTTNRKSALDQAFLRRIRFVVDFPFPEIEQRAEIWRRAFPESTPTEGLHIERLARLNAAGGHIKNIAMGAAFLAADASQPVRMAHLLAAARSEFAKLEKPLTDTEIAGWV
jgi:AAA+ superfamily predicted ATPase